MDSVAYQTAIVNILFAEPVPPVVPALPSAIEASRDRRVREIIHRAVAGDWAEHDLEAVAGNLLIAGCTLDGATMWMHAIAAMRVRLALQEAA